MISVKIKKLIRKGAIRLENGRWYWEGKSRIYSGVLDDSGEISFKGVRREEYLSEEEREDIIRDIKEDRNNVSLDNISLKEREDLLLRDRRRFHMI